MADLSSVAQSPYNTGALTSSLSSNVNGALGKEDFLKLLVTQLSHQDPMSPTDPTEFVSQLSQFSSLEQLMNVKSGLDLLAITQTAGTSAQMVSFIGKTVSFESSSLNWHQGDAPTTPSFKLGAAASEVKVTLRDASGTAVNSFDLGAMKAGDQAFAFTGLDKQGKPLKTGTYSVEITAKDAAGNPVSVTQRNEGLVTGVTFENGYPELVLEDGRTLGLSQILEVLAQASAKPEVTAPIPDATDPVSAAPTLPLPTFGKTPPASDSNPTGLKRLDLPTSTQHRSTP